MYVRMRERSGQIQWPLAPGFLGETIDVDRAVKQNRIWGQRLGWHNYINSIVRLLGFTTYTPDDRTFAEGVARWQQNQGLPDDGVIEAKTWEKMRTIAKIGPFINIKPGVRMTSFIQKAVDELEPYFRGEGLRVRLTSGYRSPEDQLNLIRRKALQYDLHKKYPQILTATVDDVESWRNVWDELLNIYGFVVNPPTPTVSRIGKRAGKKISSSPHSTKKAFDLSNSNLNHIETVLKRYQQEGGPIKQVLVETVNKCVHVGLA
jgi:hypothetical protein